MIPRAILRVGQQSQNLSLSSDLGGVGCPESSSHGRKMVSLSERQAKSQEEEIGTKCLQCCWPLGTREQLFRQDGESGCMCECWERVSTGRPGSAPGRQVGFSVSGATFVISLLLSLWI